MYKSPSPGHEDVVSLPDGGRVHEALAQVGTAAPPVGGAVGQGRVVSEALVSTD